MFVRDLWSTGDEQALAECRDALRREDIVDALLAIEDAPPAQRTACRRQIDDWAGAAGALAQSGGPEVQAAVLRHVLCERGGLKGDPERYYEPENCYLSAVVRRRIGMPILLATVWMAVGRAAGIRVQGVGLPGHFIARIGEDPALLVDPFSAGRPLTTAHCAALVKRLTDGQLAWRDEYLSPTPLDAIVLRVLRNVVHCHQRRDEGVPSYRAARLAAELFGAEPAAHLLHARAAEQAGLAPLAIGIYQTVAERFAGCSEAHEALDCAARLAQDAPTIH